MKIKEKSTNRAKKGIIDPYLPKKQKNSKANSESLNLCIINYLRRFAT